MLGGVDALSDQALLDAVGAGETRAFEVLYERHGTVVYRIALRAAGQAQDAADATQEAFVHVLERAGELRLTGRLSTYLYPVVVRLARRARERAGRATAGSDALAEALEGLAAGDTAPQADARAALAPALARLPEAQREALLLRHADGFTVQEAAAALDCPEGTVRSRVHLALEALRSDPIATRLLGPP